MSTFLLVFDSNCSLRYSVQRHTELAYLSWPLWFILKCAQYYLLNRIRRKRERRRKKGKKNIRENSAFNKVVKAYITNVLHL